MLDSTMPQYRTACVCLAVDTPYTITGILQLLYLLSFLPLYRDMRPRNTEFSRYTILLYVYPAILSLYNAELYSILRPIFLIRYNFDLCSCLTYFILPVRSVNKGTFQNFKSLSLVQLTAYYNLDSIVGDYRLDERGSISGRGNGFFSSSCVLTSSEKHPASYPIDTGNAFPETKRGRGVTLTTHPVRVPRSSMSRSYTSSPLSRLHGK
jgi:hypothetical protein